MLLVTAQDARRLTQGGLAVAGLGALCLIWVGAILLGSDPNTRRRGWLTIFAGFLLGLGFAIEIYAIHLSGSVKR